MTNRPLVLPWLIRQSVQYDTNAVLGCSSAVMHTNDDLKGGHACSDGQANELAVGCSGESSPTAGDAPP